MEMVTIIMVVLVEMIEVQVDGSAQIGCGQGETYW